jgi:hypothetical protein
MLDQTLRLLAISACVTMSAATAAAGGCCPDAVGPCACPPVVVQQVVAPPPVEILVVNQGPVYSGPGPYLTQRNYIEGDQLAPYGFPYVGFLHADTYGGGYRSFHSGSYHSHYRHFPARYRYRYAKPVRAHPKVDPGYE